MFKATMCHTEDTCLRLARVQNEYFGKTRNVIRLALAAIPAFLGYAVGLDTAPGALLIVFACFFYYKTSFMYERDGKKAYAQTPGRFLDVEYEFGRDGLLIRSGGIEKTIDYPSLRALVSDKEYGYLFINSQQAYMFELGPQAAGQHEELWGFLQKKTGLALKKTSARPSFIHFLRGRQKTDW